MERISLVEILSILPHIICHFDEGEISVLLSAYTLILCLMRLPWKSNDIIVVLQCYVDQFVEILPSLE
jgi:hypothetical protein